MSDRPRRDLHLRMPTRHLYDEVDEPEPAFEAPTPLRYNHSFPNNLGDALKVDGRKTYGSAGTTTPQHNLNNEDIEQYAGPSLSPSVNPSFYPSLRFHRRNSLSQPAISELTSANDECDRPLSVNEYQSQSARQDGDYSSASRLINAFSASFRPRSQVKPEKQNETNQKSSITETVTKSHLTAGSVDYIVSQSYFKSFKSPAGSDDESSPAPTTKPEKMVSRFLFGGADRVKVSGFDLSVIAPTST